MMVKRSGTPDCGISKRAYRLRVQRASNIRNRMRNALVARQTLNVAVASADANVAAPLNAPSVEEQHVDAAPLYAAMVVDEDEPDESSHEEVLVKDDSEEVLRDDIRHWAHEHNTPQRAISSLLTILRKAGVGGLPLDSRTLLHIPKTRDVISIPPGEYCHLGLVKAMDVYMRNCEKLPTQLTLDFNIDGLPIYESNQKGFWLILV